MGPNVSNIIYSSFENLFNALCHDETLFVGSQCNDPNIVIYIGDIAVISGIGLIGLNAVIGLIGVLGAPGDAYKYLGSMPLTRASFSEFIEKLYALIIGIITWEG